MFEKDDIFSRNFENFEKSWKIKKIIENAALLYELSEREPGWRFTARCHTETVAKRARVGPRTQVVFTLQKLFQKRILFESEVGSPIIILDYVVKI